MTDQTTRRTGRQSHGGVYRDTAQRAESAADAIRKWRLHVEIQRQTACVKFWKEGSVDTLGAFYWHPMKKQFRATGDAEWNKLPKGQGIVALLMHLFGKAQLVGVPHFAAISRWERGEQPIGQQSSAAVKRGEPASREALAWLEEQSVADSASGGNSAASHIAVEQNPRAASPIHHCDTYHCAGDCDPPDIQEELRAEEEIMRREGWHS